MRSWLADEPPVGFAARHGFRVLKGLRVDAYRQPRIARSGQPPIALSTVDLSGRLAVATAEKFTRALLYGVGRAKAFGCGLPLVRRG